MGLLLKLAWSESSGHTARTLTVSPTGMLLPPGA